MRYVGAPRVSIIIPSRDGDRGGAVAKLLQSIERQTFTDVEVVLVVGVFPQGRAINRGVRRARGDIAVIVDDDSELASPTTIAELVDALDRHPTIGLAGASIIPRDDASDFERRANAQFPRLCTRRVDRITDSDLACHGCCAIRRDLFWKIGGEREDIVRGLDPDLRVRIRDAGYRVVLVPKAAIHHPVPMSWRNTARLFFRNGRGSAYAWKFQPDSVYDTHEQTNDTSFRPRNTLGYRIARYPGRLARALLTRQWIRLFAYVVYAAGYLWGLIAERKIEVQSDGGEQAGCIQVTDSRAA